MKAPLSVTLTCRRCGEKAAHTFDYAVVDADPAEVDPAWDGVVFSAISRCPKCGAEDDYDLDRDDRKRIVQAAWRNPSVDPFNAPETGDIWRARSVLHDGTVVKRPSQSLAHAREVAAAHPRSAADQRRLGNVCHRFGYVDEAERAWRRALELSSEEAEAAFSLAVCLWESERWQEALGFVELTLERYPEAKIKPRLLAEIGERLARILQEATQMPSEPVALMLALEEGVTGDEVTVTLSSVSLHRVRDWERLGSILGSGRVLKAALISDVPDPREGPTQLELMLAGDSPFTRVRRAMPRWEPGRSSLSKKRKRRRAG